VYFCIDCGRFQLQFIRLQRSASICYIICSWMKQWSCYDAARLIRSVRFLRACRCSAHSGVPDTLHTLHPAMSILFYNSLVVAADLNFWRSSNRSLVLRVNYSSLRPAALPHALWKYTACVSHEKLHYFIDAWLCIPLNNVQNISENW